MVDLTVPDCPRCGQGLQSVELQGVGMLSCGKCHGTLLREGQLPRVLEAMSEELRTTFNPDGKLEALSDAGAVVTCPACKHPMGHDNYCGANLVFFDRCESCGALWLDTDELGTMTLMWARMEARHARDHAEGERIMAEVDAFVDHVRISRAVSNVLFRVLR